MASSTEVAIVGAGPYGLSIAAHLQARNVRTRIFGKPMHFWATTMCRGKLKSEGFATNLSEPTGQYTLGAFCRERGEPYTDTGIPIPFTTFTEYGRSFQRRFVPHVEDNTVTQVETVGNGFRLTLDNGQQFDARKVVLATGITPFRFTPPELRQLPDEVRSHSSQYGDLTHFAGREVIVVGSGASATDLAAHLNEDGAKVTIVMRKPELRFQEPLGSRSMLDKLRAPMTALGPGWKSVLCVQAPSLFHAMPEAFRLEVVRRYLGPGAAWFVRDRVEGLVDVVTGVTIDGAEAAGGRVQLRLGRAGSGVQEMTADHVIAATGYKVDVDGLQCLGRGLRDRLSRAADRSPVLSRHFESSVPGLYFTGTASANSFGPMLRFVYGADFASRRITGHVAGATLRWPARRALQLHKQPT